MRFRMGGIDKYGDHMDIGWHYNNVQSTTSGAAVREDYQQVLPPNSGGPRGLKSWRVI
jgi:Tfp pilus assembly protein PilV